jgi:hypothetical protein
MWKFLTSLFRGKGAGPNQPLFHKAPESKLLRKEVETDISVPGGGAGKITLKNLSYPETIEVEAQVFEIMTALESKNFDKEVIELATKNIRVYMVLLFACYVGGKRLFETPEEVGRLMDIKQQTEAFIAYGDAFVLTEKERGNWWRERIQVLQS